MEDVTPDANTGTKQLEKYLNRSLFDAVALGPRAALGMLNDVAGLPGRVAGVTGRLWEIASQDPRPLQEKPLAAADEVSRALLELVETGEDREKEVLAAVVAGLPEDVKARLPQELLSQIEKQSTYYTDVSVVDGAAGGAGAAGAPPSAEPGVVVVRGEAVRGADNAAAEVLKVQGAVATLASDLDLLLSNTSPGKDRMLRLNAQDAARALEGALAAVSASTRALSSAPVEEAVAEAEALLAEVRAALAGGPAGAPRS